MDDALGSGMPSVASSRYQSKRSNAWVQIRGLVQHERGLFFLHSEHEEPREDCLNYFLKAETAHAVDFIQMSFSFIDSTVRIWSNHQILPSGAKLEPDQAIYELNHRLREHSVGYRYEAHQIIRMDSEVLHAEAVTPALRLLSELSFEGPNEEYLRAHDHYRHNRHKEAIAAACMAFESTMKAICDARGWPYSTKVDKNGKPRTDKKDAATLIETLMTKGLFPRYLENELSQLKNLLEGGAPTLRNQDGSHGQGAEVREVPDRLAGYALHLTAANIVLLVEAHKALK